MLTGASLAAIAERGVRVLADYLPARGSRSADYERIFELEQNWAAGQSMPQSPATHTAWQRCVSSVAETVRDQRSCPSFGHRIQREGT